jgi:uncharacterized protein (DUF2235 family)
MWRNLDVMCCDGTANEFAKHNTHVVRLYAALHPPRLHGACGRLAAPLKATG